MQLCGTGHGCQHSDTFAVLAMAPFNAACDGRFDGAGDVRNTGALRDFDGHQPVSGSVPSGGQRR